MHVFLPPQQGVGGLRRLVLLLFCFSLILLIAPAARAQCDLKILSVYPCDASGAPSTPLVNEPFYVRVHFAVVGAPARQYKIRWQLLNRTWDWTTPPLQPGSSYSAYAGFVFPCAEGMPYKLTLDPDNVAGDTNRSNNEIAGVCLPRPPSKAIEYYDPKRWRGTQTFTIDFVPGSGTITNGYLVLGQPTTGSFQTAFTSAAPGATLTTTAPNNQPVWIKAFGALTPTQANHSWTVNQEFTIESRNVRINPSLLRRVRWTQLEPSLLPADVRGFLAPDTLTQSDDPVIRRFVRRSLPRDYQRQRSHGPYDTARQLFLATIKELSYETPWVENSAKGVLTRKKGDCGGFAVVFIASCRSVGIPARLISGWWSPETYHAMAEFYLPGVGWIPADASDADAVDPTGTYLLMFGNIDTLHNFCAVGRGTDFRTSYAEASMMQTGALWYWGNAQWNRATTVSSLTPL